MEDIDRIVAVAVAAARKAGAIQREKYGGALNVDKRMQNDLKLEADRLCEAALIGDIRAAFPAHAILAEESGAAAGEGHVWYVDPLDGTVNFYYGIPYFCTTLACYRRPGPDRDGAAGLGEPLVGVTYAPLQDEMFVGVAGRGTTLNGAPVRVREEANLGEAMLITSLTAQPEKIAFTRDRLLPLARRVTKVRGLGACAYDLANVAAGRGSGFFEYGVNAWDMAAGKVLVEAAGGRFSAWPAEGGKWLVAASGKSIHDELSAAVRP